MAVTLHLVRHGRSDWNDAGRLQGQTMHVELTELGREQARAAARTLGGLPVVALYSSDLVRAVQTATPIAAGLGVAVRLEPGLREQAYGELEGVSSAGALAATAGLDWADAELRIGGGESIRDVHTRLGVTLTKIITTHRGGQVVLVSHGDAIRVALAWLSGYGAHEVPWRDVPNGSISTVEVG